MKKLLLFAGLMLLASAQALCQEVTVTFKVNGNTSYELPVPGGNGSVSYSIALSKPNNQVVSDGWIYVYLKPATGDAFRIATGLYIAAADWGTGNPSRVNRDGSFSLTPSQLGNVTGKVYAQFEEDVIYKSGDVTMTVPIFENMITSPTTVDFIGSGDPGVITGSLPKGGNGTYTYQWQSSTTSTTTGFSNISSATGKNYDPPLSTVVATTFYRRIATSDGLNNASNAVRITIATSPISNNVIIATGATAFAETGDPTIINGNTPSGGSGGSYTYQWESANLANPSSFTTIIGATTQNFDPPALTFTTYYRRKATSGSTTGYSNIIAVTIQRAGTTMSNPIDMGSFNVCSSYSAYKWNSAEYGYGNEYGNSTDDIFYKFTLTAQARISIANCKSDGVSGNFYLLNASGNIVPSDISLQSCDVGNETINFLQPGVYYVVSEGISTEMYSTNALPMHIYAVPIFTTSSDVTIVAGTSTTLQASGSGVTYTWSPATGLNTTTGASVIASPLYNTTYMVRATSPYGCNDVKYINVKVTGSPGSTFNSPRLANVSGCGYSSGLIDPVGYGNEYGEPYDDIYFKFTLTTASEVFFDIYYVENKFHLALLNSSGALVAEKYYTYGDGEYFSLVPVDGVRFKPTLQPGTYYLVAEGWNGNTPFGITIDTPSGYNCRKITSQSQVSYQSASPSETAYVSTETETDNVSEVSVYPNPAKDQITVFLKQDEPATVQFISASGVVSKQVTTAGKSATINISDLPAGLYLMNIVQGYSVYRKKLLTEK